ncbi:hypothetical protein A374_17229 [Fictibacillus macauensis ZFHKF-1]|uniref:YetF C-terminal domain-containing protein n=1 Tax=Fictibacillus macauensis ZFHKF-1 TaxID=1196324 RepID=I8IX24_9BACL|nr:DUF421 domain-containing protein [Fictibacillus macauensis]EIT84021.1 hypothetical protein A374_17229 [Fictibacillus macauensis ZFHKF-1]
MEEHLSIIWRSLLAFLLFMIIARMLGKQMLSFLTLNHFIAAATLGSITGNLAFNLDVGAMHTVTAMGVFFFTAIFTLWLTLKSRRARRWISGEPTVVIEDGKILETNMKKAKFDIDNLNQMLRQKGIFNVDHVQYAILESNGQLSVRKKYEFRMARRKDLPTFKPATTVFPVELIIEKQILKQNLAHNDLTEEWLHKELRNRKLSLEDIYYAVKGTKGQLYFDCYNDGIQSPIDKE